MRLFELGITKTDMESKIDENNSDRLKWFYFTNPFIYNKSVKKENVHESK